MIWKLTLAGAVLGLISGTLGEWLDLSEAASGVLGIGLVYIAIGAIQLYKGNVPGFTVWTSYGVANFGLMYTVK